VLGAAVDVNRIKDPPFHQIKTTPTIINTTNSKNNATCNKVSKTALKKHSKSSALMCQKWPVNPLPVQFTALLHGQKGCVFFSGHLNLRTTPETGLPSRKKKS